MSMQHKFDQLHKLIGKTPLYSVDYLYKGDTFTIYAKAEQYNWTGSIKDRFALHCLESAWKQGILTPNSKIVEATSGNTGISFAALGRYLGLEVHIFMPDWLSSERYQMMQSFGATITLVSREAGGFLGCIAKTQELATQDSNVFLPKQFDSVLNIDTHRIYTASEIALQLQSIDISPAAFIAGVGTGATIMGCQQGLHPIFPYTKFHPLEPANSPTLSTGYKTGKHRIQGISDDFIPSIVQLNDLNKVVSVDDGDSIYMAQQLSQKLGLGVGISCGANFLGSIMMQQEYQGEPVVTIFADCNKKYFSTDYGKQTVPQDTWLSTQIQLLDFRVIKNYS
jgi:cysteine synthase